MLALVLSGIGAGSCAQGLISMQKLSAPLANELMGESVVNCAVRRVLRRGNGAPIHTLDNAFFKASSATPARPDDSEARDQPSVGGGRWRIHPEQETPA